MTPGEPEPDFHKHQEPFRGEALCCSGGIAWKCSVNYPMTFSWGAHTDARMDRRTFSVKITPRASLWNSETRRLEGPHTCKALTFPGRFSCEDVLLVVSGGDSKMKTLSCDKALVPMIPLDLKGKFSSSSDEMPFHPHPPNIYKKLFM